MLQVDGVKNDKWEIKFKKVKKRYQNMSDDFLLCTAGEVDFGMKQNRTS